MFLQALAEGHTVTNSHPNEVNGEGGLDRKARKMMENWEENDGERSEGLYP